MMSAAPLKRKQYVLAASNQSEMRQRFDEVALDNRAALKQQAPSQEQIAFASVMRGVHW